MGGEGPQRTHQLGFHDFLVQLQHVSTPSSQHQLLLHVEQLELEVELAAFELIDFCLRRLQVDAPIPCRTARERVAAPASLP